MDHAITVADVVETIVVICGAGLGIGTLIFLFALFARGFDH